MLMLTSIQVKFGKERCKKHVLLFKCISSNYQLNLYILPPIRCVFCPNMIRNLALVLLLSVVVMTFRVVSGSPLEDIEELLAEAEGRLDQDEGAEVDSLVPSRSDVRPWGGVPFFRPIEQEVKEESVAGGNRGDKEEEQKARMLNWLTSRHPHVPRVPKKGEVQEEEPPPRTTLREVTSVLIPRYWEDRRGQEKSDREAAIQAAVDAEVEGFLRKIAPYILRKIKG